MNDEDFPRAVKAELLFQADIRIGAKRMTARRVQEWLTFHGFATAIDDDFGTATHGALLRFQRKRGLNESGIVDEQTWHALTAPLSEAFRDGSGASLGARIASIADRHAKIHPIELGGPNRGVWVRAYTGGYEGADYPWCGGFVSSILKQACIELGIAPPIRGSLSCDSLASQANIAGLFVSESDLKKGKRSWSELGKSYIFLVRRTPQDWKHTGWGFGGSPEAFQTVEGNTNNSGSSNGFEVCTQTRSAVKKDFIAFV